MSTKPFDRICLILAVLCLLAGLANLYPAIYIANGRAISIFVVCFAVFAALLNFWVIFHKPKFKPGDTVIDATGWTWMLIKDLGKGWEASNSQGKTTLTKGLFRHYKMR